MNRKFWMGRTQSDNKPVVIEDPNSVVRKEFGGSIGDTSLKFTLRTDIEDELKRFLTLLEEAVVDVKNELKKFENHE